MTDTWGVHLYAKDGVILWQGEAEKDGLLDPNLMWAGYHAHFITKPNKPIRLGELGRAHVIKNHVVYAVHSFNFPASTSTAYVGSGYGQFGFCINDDDLQVRAAVKADCCCGCWKTYGKDSKLHADWCDVK